MNVNQLVNMAIRMIMRRGVNAGINRGIDIASRGGRSEDEMTSEERQAARNTRGNAQQARQGMRFLRRFMR